MKKTKIKCHNCNEELDVYYRENRWVKWIEGYCEICGWRFRQDADYIQPDSPFFEIAYKFNPEKEAELNKKKHEWEEEQRKAGLDKKYWKKYRGNNPFSRVKTSEEKSIRKEVLNNG